MMMRAGCEKFKCFSVADLPEKTLRIDENGKLRLRLLDVLNPDEFYARAVVDPDEEQQYAQLDTRLNEFYGERESQMRAYAASHAYNFVFERALCVCKSKIRHDGGGGKRRFHRVQVKYLSQCEKRCGGGGGMTSSPSKHSLRSSNGGDAALSHLLV